ncbi:uncharacterized protein BXZ73DRAFT_100897 [Epithele typhae]|uniref:uncharacterized protein n=1 Tax=Epithele typhae TaxID=378194 RepID=UPI002008231D|nr:uncharacterized protein BXZ73DRAFT_100897 [Epithele typhae]KAH9934056.1 hypothetical protein BXZ73DRAFT_100897 [Epithele typhae]
MYGNYHAEGSNGWPPARWKGSDDSDTERDYRSTTRSEASSSHQSLRDSSSLGGSARQAIEVVGQNLQHQFEFEGLKPVLDPSSDGLKKSTPSGELLSLVHRTLSDDDIVVVGSDRETDHSDVDPDSSVIYSSWHGVNGSEGDHSVENAGGGGEGVHALMLRAQKFLMARKTSLKIRIPAWRKIQTPPMTLFDTLRLKLSGIPSLPTWISGCKDNAMHFWRLHVLMNNLIDRTISVDDVRSPEPLYSCIVTQLDHILDPNDGHPREYIIAHVALPHARTPSYPTDAPPPSEPAPPRPLGLIKFQRCWKGSIPVEQYDKCGCSSDANRAMWLPVHDAVNVYGPFLDPVTGRRRMVLRSSRAPLTLVRLVVAACALRRLHVEAYEDTHAHAWFARALWERLVPAGSADVVYPASDWRTWLAGYARWLGGSTPAASEPGADPRPGFDAVLEGAEAEACRAIEDGALGEFAAARAKIAECLSPEGEWVSPEDQAKTVEDISDAVDTAMWGDFRDLKERKDPLMALAHAELERRLQANIAHRRELAALPGEGQEVLLPC